jgi:hypothetical protein
MLEVKGQLPKRNLKITLYITVKLINLTNSIVMCCKTNDLRDRLGGNKISCILNFNFTRSIFSQHDLFPILFLETEQVLFLLSFLKTGSILALIILLLSARF